MKAMWISTLLTVLVIGSSSIQADGLIHKLPKDGTWVEFKIEGSGIKGNNPKDVIQVEGTLRISSVGLEVVNNEKCRWIEIDLTIDAESNVHVEQYIMKLLIPEKHLKRGEAPAEHILRGWRQAIRGGRKRDIRKVREVNGKPDAELSSMFLVGPLKDIIKLDAETVVVKGEKLKCKGEKGRFTVQEPRGNKNREMSGIIWVRLHEKTPFGVAFYRIDAKGPDENVINLNFKLINHGKGAKSRLPDHK